MAVDENSPIISQGPRAGVRHPIRAARLLYTVPSVVLRGPIYVIFIILFVAIVYSFWARKDSLVLAPLTLDTRSTTVEAISGGQVTRVAVSPNSHVQFNELLVEVQEKTRAIMDTEMETFEGRIAEAERERERLTDEYEYKLAQLRLELADSNQGRSTKAVSIQGRIDQLNERLRSAQRELNLRSKEYKTAQSRWERAQKRFENRDITITQFESAEQENDRRRKAVSDARATVAEIVVSLRTAKKELSTLQDMHSLEKIEENIHQLEERQARELKLLNDSILSLKRRKAASQELVGGVTYDDNITAYRSMLDGLVTEVHVNRGQIISPGHSLVTLVKDTAALEARAMVENKDIGSIRIGQSAKLKFWAYPYQEYGILEGVIYEIDKQPSKDETTSAYQIRIALDSEWIQRIGSKVRHPLAIGLEGTAEIKTGEKRWIEIVFTPLSKFFGSEEGN
ncbi:HlyD family efflux transporter periplasmic adaptor subunit [uncultured Pseudodesulfovibrio sp.]|uniref:HlyD family secretion protein n=1 Tax=uncultured Pseudodesulfovibrio sp. TaxID=2035858 RepID=UPI0029C7EB09|nr:HlyD family efflux transporter periplasmic adaptor subunit [uncultured Pseudodesulfovibrio sp.]